MPARNDLEQIWLDDFTPGIVDYLQTGVSQKAPLGAAQRIGTQGCIAAPNGGGLIPAPGVSDLVTNSAIETGTFTATTYRPTSAPDNWASLGGIFVYSNAISTSTGASLANLGARNEDCDTIFFGAQYYRDPAGAGSPYSVMGRVIVMKRSISPIVLASADVGHNTAIDYTGVSRSGFGKIAFAAGSSIDNIGRTDPLLTGFPVVASDSAIIGGTAIVGQHLITIFPSLAGASLGNSNAVQGTILPSGSTYRANAPLFTQHQGRLVSCDYWSEYAALALYGTLQYPAAPNVLNYTPVNNYISGAGVLLPLSFEQPNGYGAMVSTSDNELLLIGHEGGAVIIRGDLDDPTIIRQPKVESIGGLMNVPTNSPIGVVYGTSRGVFAWNGNDTSTPLSPQLPFDFWIPDHTDDVSAANNLYGMRGQFAYLYPFIFAPNGYVFDLRTNGWFKLYLDETGLSNSSGVACWAASARSNLVYGTLNVIVNSSLDDAAITVGKIVDLTTRAPTYSWVSHIIPATERNYIHIREVICIYQTEAVGDTVQITLTNVDGATASVTFTSTVANKPIVQVLDIGPAGGGEFKVTNLQVSIVGTNTVGTLGAPHIHRIGFGYNKRESL